MRKELDIEPRECLSSNLENREDSGQSGVGCMQGLRQFINRFQVLSQQYMYADTYRIVTPYHFIVKVSKPQIMTFVARIELW